jgi:hypothetical protein
VFFVLVLWLIITNKLIELLLQLLEKRHVAWNCAGSKVTN